VKKILIIVSLLLLAACSTSPTGRKQFIIVGDQQMNRMGIASFQQMKTAKKVSHDPRANAYVRCVASAIVQQLPDKWRQQPWEVVVFEDDTANAFALPGGKIGVHTGLLKVAKTPDQLAAVLGHEVAHVLARHGAERVSQTLGAQVALQVANEISQRKMTNPAKQRALMSALGLGTQVGVLLPFSRTHETEADVYGLDLMASAGFDPRQSVDLWKNMDAASKGRRPPQFLSTHPEPANRIRKLEERLPHALQLMQQAHQQGRIPQCRVDSQGTRR
jgi:predicted Zn-dependent protease